MPLPAGDHATGVVEPGEEAFDLPATRGPTQRPAVSRASTAPTMSSDHLDAIRRHEGGVEAVAVVAAAAD